MAPKSIYFIQRFCDRCNSELSKERMMSFFSNDTHCLKCSRKEEEIRTKIREKWGANADLQYERCGFVPDLKNEGFVTRSRQPDSQS